MKQNVSWFPELSYEHITKIFSGPNSDMEVFIAIFFLPQSLLRNFLNQRSYRIVVTSDFYLFFILCFQLFGK